MSERSLLTRRSSGVLLHITSLPNRWGIGDLGPGAHSFLDWLEAAGQSLWQILPLGPTGEGASWGVATRRWMLQLAHVVPIVGALIVVGIGVVSVVYLFTDRCRQTVHDRFAGSLVVTASSMKRSASSNLRDRPE